MRDDKYRLVLSLRTAALRFDQAEIQRQLPLFLDAFAGQLEPSTVIALQAAKDPGSDELTILTRLILNATENLGSHVLSA